MMAGAVGHRIGSSPARAKCWSSARRAKGESEASKRRKRKSQGERANVSRKYFIETFGCQMNYHDSEQMAGLLEVRRL